jgi:hypothetical protein
LGIGRAAPGSLFLCGLPALIFHLAAIKAHVRIVSEAGRESIGEQRRIAVKCGEAGSTLAGGLLHFFGPSALERDELIVIGALIVGLNCFQVWLRRRGV